MAVEPVMLVLTLVELMEVLVVVLEDGFKFLDKLLQKEVSQSMLVVEELDIIIQVNNNMEPLVVHQPLMVL